jgi:hypothetical protein
MSKARRRGAAMRLEAWLEEVVVEREKGTDEELVKRSCVGSAEWLFRSRVGGFIRVWPAAANRAVARCTTVCPWNGRQMTYLSRHDGGIVDSVGLSNGATRLQCPRGLNTLRAVC